MAESGKTKRNLPPFKLITSEGYADGLMMRITLSKSKAERVTLQKELDFFRTTGTRLRLERKHSKGR
jgi:hypothetical protein